MLRSITILKLSHSVKSKLQSMGYEYVEDIEQVLYTGQIPSPQIETIFQDHKILEKINSFKNSAKIISAANLWHSELCKPPLTLFHKGLDLLMDGGLPPGRITEVCGAPGCGKTQMCIQFCVDVQMPLALGGSAGKALYISTDFGFGVERLRQMIEGCIEHCTAIEFPNKSEILKNFTVDALLDGVHVLRLYDLRDLFQSIKNLGNFLDTNDGVKLLVIDSFSVPLVAEVEDLFVRSKIIAQMLDTLQRLSLKYGFAVVLTNQLVTVMTSSNKAILKPSLGEGFGHRLHRRLLLDDGKMYLTKSISHSQILALFEITQYGIR